MAQRKFTRTLLLLLTTALFGCLTGLRAQLISPVGVWHTYLSHFSIIDITHRGEEVFAITQGGMFSYNPKTRESKSFSTINGMSNLIPTAIYSDQESGTIFIGYQDGTINTLDSAEQFGYITDISRSDLFTTLRINNFTSQNGLLYVATEFGVVVYDIKLKETRYSITKFSDNQSGIPVNDLAIAQGHLWVGLGSEGLYSASLNEPNITFPSAWVKESGKLGLPGGRIPFVASASHTIYVNVADTIFQLGSTDTSWTYSPFPFEDWQYMAATEDQVFACVGSLSYLLKMNGTLEYTDNFGTAISCHATGDTIWAGDLTEGLQWFPPGKDRLFASPPGPLNNYVTAAAAGNGQLYIAPRGKKGFSDRFFDKSGIPYFNYLNGGWKVISHRNGMLSQDSVWQDFARAYFDELSGKCYIGSFAEGIVVLKDGEVQQIYNNDNSGLVSKEGRNRVSGLEVDEFGNLWVTQIVNDWPIHALTPEGEWYRFRPTIMDPIGIEIDNYNNKWIINQSQGLVVFSDNYTPEDPSDDQYKRLTTDFGQGGLPDNSVFAITQDLDEQMWIGTSDGITIFYDPSVIWTSDFQDAVCPIIDGFCLLRGQQVNDIVVDAANRKWIATENGVYQVNEDGTELLTHFTEQNSPLPDDDVKALALDQSTGEVFFGTAKGTVSYIGESIRGSEELAKKLYAFPNPVRVDYPEIVMIKNMQQESIVKITTTTGLVVRELTSLGGQVPWDMTDTYGNRVPPGIYLIMVATADGQSTGITKLAVIEKPN